MSIIPTIIYSIVIILLIILFERLVWKSKIHEEYAFGLVKLGILSVLIYAVFTLQNIYSIAVICGFPIIVIALLYQIHMFRSTSIIRSKFPHLIIMFVTIFILVLLLRHYNDAILLITIMIYGYSDTLAGFFGDIFGRKYFHLTSHKKSYTGIIYFVLFTFIILFSADLLTSADFYGIESHVQYHVMKIMAAAAVVIIVTSFKIISSNDWENFIVPVSTAVLLNIFTQNLSMDLLINFYTGMAAAALIAGISYYLRFLTGSGSWATFILASFLFGLGSWQWSIPIMSFFVLSSLLSKIRKKSNREVEEYFEKTGVRDHFQVLANGGLGGILVIFYHFNPSDMFFLMYLASLSAVCADTWATEIGTMRKAKTYNIINLKPVQQGVSGGISFIGTLGALFGTIIIAFSGSYWFNENFLLYFLVVIIAGITGSFFDSFLGATIQLQFTCRVCGKITERKKHCGEMTNTYRGVRWITNDVVNSFAAVSGILIVILYWTNWN